VEGQAPGPRAISEEGRIRRSWRLATIAWRLVRRDRTMLVLALLGAAFATGASALILYLGGYFRDPDQSRGHLALIGLISLYPATLVSVFFNVALAGAAGAALEGKKVSVRQALSASLKKLDRIALWSLIAAGVGLLLNQIASRLPWGGKLATWLVGAAWSLATIFVVPILALEGVGPTAAVRRSSRLVRERWGEAIAGTLTIAAWTVVVIFPACFVLGIGGAMVGTNAVAAGILIAAGLMTVVLISAFSGAVSQVFVVALYRFATDGSAVGFPVGDLEQPFFRRGSARRKRSGTWLRVLAICMAVLVAAGLLSALLTENDQRGSSTAPPTRYTASLPLEDRPFIKKGTAIYWFHERAGEVFDLAVANRKIVVYFRLKPRYAERGLTTDLQLFRSKHPDIAWFAMVPESR
jgi:hypothetical protein